MDGKPQQEPAVIHAPIQVEGNTHAFSVIWGNVPVLRRIGIVQHVGDGFSPGFLKVFIGDSQANFGAFRRLLQVGNQAAQGLAFLLQLHGPHNQYRNQVHAVVKEMVLLQCGMTTGFNGQGAFHAFRIQADGLVNHVPVAPFIAIMLAAPVIDEGLQPGGSNRIRHDGLAGLFIQQYGGNQRNQPVSVDLPPVRIHNGSTVAVRIENHTQISPYLQHCLPQGGHGFRIFRVRNVIREVTIRLKELATFHPCPQVFQHGGIESAGAVACIHHHMESQQRLGHVRIQTLANPLAQLFHIGRQKGFFGDTAAEGHAFRLQGRGNCQQLCHVVAFQSPIGQEEFQSILVPGMMAGRYHDGTVRRKGGRNNAHIHGRGGAHAEVNHRCPGTGNAFRRRFQKGRSGQTAIPTDGNGDLSHRLIQLFRCKPGKGHA